MTDDKWANHPRVVGVSHQGELPAESEKYTEEQQKRRAFRSNKPFFPKQLHFNSQASSDAIKHFVHGIGDENPLFCNKEYALKSKYGTIIAPGSFLYSVLWTIRGAGPSGLHGWYVGGDWEWYRPILAGDEFRVVCIIKDMVEKKGRMGAGRTWIGYDDVI